MEERSEVVDWDARIEMVDPTLAPPMAAPIEQPKATPAPEVEKLTYKEALKLLDDFAIEKTFSCWIPSMGKEVQFKEITAAQQKELLKSIVDSPFFKSKFITTTYELLKKNYVTPELGIQFDQFNIIDKQLILLKTRIECFNSSYELSTDEHVKTIDLNKLYNQAKKELKGFDNEPIDHDQIQILAGVPNVLTEYRLEKDLHANVDLMDINNANTLRSTLGDIFISEISKFILEISIDGKVIDFRPLNFRDRVKVVERLPNLAIQKVVAYIDKVKAVSDSITTVKAFDFELDKEVTDQVVIDGAFFSIK